MRPALFLAPLVFLPLLVAGAANAQGTRTDPAAAQALFSDARDLMQRGRFAEACPKLEESQKLDPGIGTEFNLASCYQHVGKIASAWATFLSVAGEAKAEGQTARERVARGRATALEPTLPKLLVLVHGARVPGLAVVRDDVPVGRGEWGMAVPTDPGLHEIVARAPGYAEWRGAVQVPESPGIVMFDVPALVSAPRVVGPAGVASVTGVTGVRGMTNEMPPQPEPVTMEHHRSGTGQRVGGVIVGLLGLGGIATGAVMGLESRSSRNDSYAHCTGNACDATGVDERHDAIVDGNVATGAFIGGGAALALGIILIATAPTSTVQAAPMVGQGVSGMTVLGSF